ncbi:hypothetical protein M885DRAFT_522336 [Pelagophyceae sp. CCMP2097]|nr:hypothetical protein M885DRAFT_522336 [Pelagophyceae sp. CCMP2097]
MFSDEAPLRVASLNVGGRNTNSFEFEMRGDSSPAALRWKALYSTARKCLDAQGPAHAAGLADAVDSAMRTVGASEDRCEGDLLSRALKAPTWTQAMRLVSAESSMLINACNLASLRDGRPSPMEMPENVEKLLSSKVGRNPNGRRASEPCFLFNGTAFAEFFRVWLAWLVSVPPRSKCKWTERSQKYGVLLHDAVAAMLIFDSMCFQALVCMYADDATPRTATAVMREHLKFHHWLSFTTETGKYIKLLEVLAELQFPAVVCLHEGYDLVMMASGRRDKSQLGDSLFSTFEDKYAIVHHTEETALLLRRDLFAGDGADVSAKCVLGWRAALAAIGDAIPCKKKANDWATTLARTVVVRASLHRRRTDNSNRVIPERWQNMGRCGVCPAGECVPVIVCAVHGKCGSDVTSTFLPALAKVLAEIAPDVDAFVVGMDSNTSNASEFKATLLREGIMAPEAALDDAHTVAKSRTLFQTQVRKAGVLDISLKDFIVAWQRTVPKEGWLAGLAQSVGLRTQDVAFRPLPAHVEQFPHIVVKDKRDCPVLMPTAQWPFDHAMVIADVFV